MHVSNSDGRAVYHNIVGEFETKTFNFGCDIKLFADIVSVIDTIC